MGTATLVPIDEYLSTSYEDGDREYVDGEIQERNLGEIDHSDLQGAAVSYLRVRYKGQVWAAPEVRVQVKASRFRVPDVTVALGAKPSGRIVTVPPFLVIEILSPEDRADRVQAKIVDYLEFGIPNVWVIDPEEKAVVCYTPAGMTRVSEGSLRTANPELELPLSELF
jgi:Uma2 family endonuclease